MTDDLAPEAPGEDQPLAWLEGLDLCGHMEQAASALHLVTIFALDNGEFRQLWERNVRSAADQACAAVAAARWAGETRGFTGACWVEPVDGPPGMTDEDVYAAFTLAVLGEVRRRLEVMLDRPAGGRG
jgi:hypothetical protein